MTNKKPVIFTCAGILVVALIVVLIFIFKKDNQNQNKEQETTSTDEVLNEPEETTTEDSEWAAGHQSGLEADFDKYFDVDMKDYKAPGDDKMGTIETITYHSDVVGADREAYVFLPAGYSTDTKYKVVYMLHGIGCDGGQWISMGFNNTVSSMIDKGEVEPIVAVFPSIIPKDGIDSNTLSATNIQAFTDFKDEFIKDLEPYILSNYSVSDKREDTAVCGLSMGGMEALSLAFSLPDHFNYIGSFSAAPSLDTSLLTLNGWTTTPDLILICSGDADGTVQDNPKNYHEELAKNGVEHIWYQYPGGGHSPEVWKNGLVNFLKRF